MSDRRMDQDAPDALRPPAPPPVYAASLIKSSGRATRAEMADRHEALIRIARRIQPASVRGIFYQASVLGIVEKSEAGYGRVQRDLVHLRRTGRIPFGSVVDGTRWQRKPITHDDLAAALEYTAQTYRRALWRRAPVHCEVWLEKDALAGVILPVTSLFDVPLLVARGYASLTFLHAAAEAIKADGRPVVIMHLGDSDPSGVDAGNKIEAALREFAPDVSLVFKRLAATEEQIEAYRLPTRPTKTTDSRSKRWGDRPSVELDAMDPNILRALVQAEIEALLPQHEIDVLRAAEESERDLLHAIARHDWAGDAGEGG